MGSPVSLSSWVYLSMTYYHQTMTTLVTFTLLLSVIVVQVTASPVRGAQTDDEWYICNPPNSPECTLPNPEAPWKRLADYGKDISIKNRMMPWFHGGSYHLGKYIG